MPTTTTSPRDSTTRANFKNAKLLLVEDNDDHIVIICNAVKYCLPEVTVVVVSTEREAIDYLENCRLEEWNMPKLILLDLYLPDRQSGWRVLDQIKSMPPTLSKTPVVLLSSSSSRSDIAAAYERGCSSYLVKPGALEDWMAYFQMIRTYWWETVTLPNPGVSLQ